MVEERKKRRGNRRVREEEWKREGGDWNRNG